MQSVDPSGFSEWFIALGKWIASVFVGIIGKISYEFSQRRKLSFLEWIGIIGVSVLCGYLAAIWCASNNMIEQGFFIVPIATLFGEKITQYVTENFKPLFNRLVDAILNRKK